MKRVLGFCALAGALYAGEAATYTIEGFIPNNTGPLRVAVMSIQDRDILAVGDVGANGTFEVRGVSAGLHRLSILSLRGDVLASTAISVPTFSPVEIRLPSSAAKPQGPVSLYRLQHKPPKEARKLLALAMKRLSAGRTKDAADLMGKSLEIDPGYLEALEQLSMLQCKAGRAREGALSYEPGNTRAHYLLGLSMVRMGQRGSDAVGHLEKAAGEFKGARTLLEKLR